MDIITVLLITTMVVLGMYKNIPVLSVIGGVLLLSYFYGARTAKPHVIAGKMPKVRPIIIKRRYAGPESIYPSNMKMYVESNWNTMSWWEKALGAAGQLSGMALQGGKTMQEPDN